MKTPSAGGPWRGLHVLDSGASSLPAILRLIREILVPAGANVLVYEIDFNFRFASHPELAGKDAWDRESVETLAAACRGEGIRLIPQVNCLGHQSWLEPPGALGADIAVGEGQPLGIAMSYGGPHLGIFACREALVRQMPGRIAGQTLDMNGTRGFVNTL
ncbi:MAG: hypothetical protein AAB368_04785, partial [bacterium]